jgi:hypothetical protein
VEIESMANNVYRVIANVPGKQQYVERVNANTVAEAMKQMSELHSDVEEAESMTVTLVVSRQQAIERISNLTKEARGLIAEACKIADEADVDFSWDLEYGMGGWYSSGEWHASSQSC